jgi:ubiquinone/menaquinone biosynthesis C-methylase UbiE
MSLEEEISRRYDSVAEKYFNTFHFHSDEQLIVLDKFIQLIPLGSKILDSGCGTGKDTVYLNKKGLQATGIDISPGMLNYAKIAAKNSMQDIEFIRVNMMQIPFSNNYFKGIWSNSSLAHIEDKDKVLAEWNRVLEKDGIVHLWIQNPVHPYYMMRKEETRSNGIDKPNYAFYEGAHWFYNTQEELVKKFEKAGFSIIATGKSDQRYLSIFSKKN